MPRDYSLVKLKIKEILAEAMEMMRAGKKVSLGKLMIKYGYSEKSAKVLRIKDTKAWQEALDEINDERILRRFNKIALGKIKGGGVREQIEAGKEVMKLKDRYPDKKLRISAYGDREKVLEIAPVENVPEIIEGTKE